MKHDAEELWLDAARRAARYRAEIVERSVSPDPLALERMREGLSGEMPRAGRSAEAVLALLDELGSPATVANAGGRYFSYVVGGALPVAVAANWLATAWDQNAALEDMSPIAAHLDALAVRWMCQVLRLPDDVVGGLVSGATAGNIVALAAARTHLLDRLGWNVEARGLYGAANILALLCSAHRSVELAAQFHTFSFGRALLRRAIPALVIFV